MATAEERELIRDVITRDEYKKQLSLWHRFLNNSNKTVTTLTFIFVVTTRSLGAAYFGLGAIGCLGVVKICKQLFREARPAHTTYKVTYGMPSTHSAVMGYYATYITLASSKLPVHPSLSSLPSSLIYPLAPLAIISVATLICRSRLRLGHHTMKQVLAGVSVGVLCGTAWFTWWKDGNAQEIAWGVVRILPAVLQRYIR